MPNESAYIDTGVLGPTIVPIYCVQRPKMHSDVATSCDAQQWRRPIFRLFPNRRYVNDS
jgi:hypothetical protein